MSNVRLMNGVLRRCAGNPIVTAEAVPGASGVRHGAVIKVGEGFKGLFRVDKTDLRCGLHLGESRDGLSWRLDPRPVSLGEGGADFTAADHSCNPRVVEMDGRYLVTWCRGDESAPKVGLSWTEDFKTFKPLDDPLPSSNRTCALFPRRVGGDYAMFHRPGGGNSTAFGDIFYAVSPDLSHWGRHRFVFGGSGWEYARVGPGPGPIETKEGWLLIYHGVRSVQDGDRYFAGGALLDLDKPWKVIAWTRGGLLAPEETYERVGLVPNVVYPSSAVVEDDLLRLYYDCAGERVGAAEGRLSDIVRFVKTHGVP